MVEHPKYHLVDQLRIGVIDFSFFRLGFHLRT
jgi:hypothetical protein